MINANMQNQDHVRLLTLEADAIFGLEPLAPSEPEPPQHRILRDPSLHALLIWSSRGVVTALSPALAATLATDPDGIASQAAASIVDIGRFRLQASSTLAMTPTCMVHLQDALGLPSHAVAGGPTWVVPDFMRLAKDVHTTQGGVRIVTSDRQEHRALVAGLPRPETWDEAEWTQLVAATGTNAPWAMGVYADDDADTKEVVCVCHTPARNAEVAEAGTWTREDWRGRGLAKRAVAAWATLHPWTTTTLFYSTAKENAASQALARSLGLLEFGYIWKLLVV